VRGGLAWGVERECGEWGGIAYLDEFGWDEVIGVFGVAEGGCYVEGRGDVVRAAEVVVRMYQLRGCGVFAGGCRWLGCGVVNAICFTVGDLQEEVDIFDAIRISIEIRRLCGGGVLQGGVGDFGSGAVIAGTIRNDVGHCGT